jgi:hypothetical protein
MTSEAGRQQQMLACVLAGGDPTASLVDVGLRDWPRVLRHRAAGRGLAAYRSNARAHAARALAAGFPTVAALVGDDTLPALAADYLQSHPPERGDLAWLGAHLPAFIASSAALASEPYLADVARLDAAVAQALIAADGSPALGTLQLLADREPDSVWLQLAPGAQLLSSAYPIASIWIAHQPPTVGLDGDATADPSAPDSDPFAAVRAAFAHGRGEQALVWRQGWRVSVRAQPPAAARFVAAVLAGRALGPALDAAGDGFDFGAWLTEALGAGLLLGAALVASTPDAEAARLA